MKRIEINTTQNVVIQYELAALGSRIFAFFIDFAILMFFLWVTGMTLGIALQEYYFYFIFAPCFLFYSLAFEIFNNGQSIGKKALGIKVIKLNGIEPKVTDYLLRWVFRLIDIYLSSGTIAMLLIGSSNKNQRIGDIVAGTAVVRASSSFKLALADILKINSIDKYTPQYPEVRKFSEKDMLLVKKVIDLTLKYRNAAHYEALNDLSATIAQKLKLEQAPTDKIKFLRTLLNDYVVLTR